MPNETGTAKPGGGDNQAAPEAQAGQQSPPTAPGNPTPPAPEVPDGKDAEKQPTVQDKAPQEPPAPETKTPATDKTGKEPKAEKPKKPSRPPKDGKPDKTPVTDKAVKQPKDQKAEKQAATVGGGKASGKNSAKSELPPAPYETYPPPAPRDATRPGGDETITYLQHDDLHPFKGHPFQVREDDAMKTLTASVYDRGIDQPVLVRPRDEGGYEIVSGHRRQHAAQLAGYKNIPCVVRNMTDEEAVLAMTESNFNQRTEILPSERALALKMQLDAIKRQGARWGRGML